jgi:hypothetical protein
MSENADTVTDTVTLFSNAKYASSSENQKIVFKTTEFLFSLIENQSTFLLDLTNL